MIRRNPKEAATRLELRFKETMKILAGVNGMKQPNPHELINLKGAGKAEKALKESGNWDESIGAARMFNVTALVSIEEEFKAKSEKEARHYMSNWLVIQDDITKVYEITKIEELT